jgi:hypothetical protein
MCEARLLERRGDERLASGGKQDGKTIKERQGSRQIGAGRQDRAQEKDYDSSKAQTPHGSKGSAGGKAFYEEEARKSQHRVQGLNQGKNRATCGKTAFGHKDQSEGQTQSFARIGEAP